MLNKRITLSFTIIFLVITLSGLSLSQSHQILTTTLINQIDKLDELHQYIVWIYFIDKGEDYEERISKLKGAQNCLHHRLKEWISASVDKTYRMIIEKRVRKIRLESRWLNAVSVEATGAQLRIIATLGFVKKIENIKTFAGGQ